MTVSTAERQLETIVHGTVGIADLAGYFSQTVATVRGSDDGAIFLVVDNGSKVWEYLAFLTGRVPRRLLPYTLPWL